MNGQTAISGSLALNSTPHVIMIPASGPVRTRKLRVAAYARVSSNSEDQLHSIKKSISKRRPRLSRGTAYPSLKLNRTSYMIGGSRKEKRGMFFRVFLYGFLYQGGHAGKERT